jgi:hypothetical protein
VRGKPCLSFSLLLYAPCPLLYAMAFAGRVGGEKSVIIRRGVI